MPQTRPPSARRAAPARAHARAARSDPPFDKARLDPDDAGVRRRARKRAQRRRNNVIAWGVVGVTTFIIGGAALGVWTEYQAVQKKIALKEATLGDLRAQLERRQRRVAALGTREGKERALVEGGHLGEGERFLLFPKQTDKPKADKP